MPNYTAVNAKVVSVPIGHGQHVVARRGAMLSYTGDVTFHPAHAGGGGMAGRAGRMLSGEASPLMVAEGSGEILYGYAGLYATVVDLDGTESLTAESSRILVHDGSLTSSIVSLSSQGGLRGAVRGAATGQGLFTTQLSGIGAAVLLSHGDLLELPVTGGSVGVDPQAYVGHVGHLDIALTTLGAGSMFRDAVGQGSGESIQLKVSGSGTVFVQTSERKL